jgi:hypothetical protein
MAPAFGTSFPAAQRMIDRVHGYAPYRWPYTHPPGTPGLPHRYILVLDITHLADGSSTGKMHQLHLT